ncbi:2-dehydro-3-deoxygalactonokinase [Starkeya sp. ORNL1]|nr:2-dehydro-3-deoxygalactonokinase [Starkeya sp. ORNL1]
MSALSHVIVDWGTSSFRLWTLDRDGRVLAERRSGDGLAISGQRGFETVLESHLAALGVPGGVPVMMCGMVGSRAGWVEAAYLDAPVRLDELAARSTIAPAARRPVRILPGIAQRSPTHPDVIRGEETQLLPLALDGQSGLVCMPGTHSKWVRLADGAVESFATFMTGELFQLLRTASVVKPAVEGGEVDADGAAFADGVAAALAEPESATNRFFELRAGWLLAGTASDDALARLSGLLIGVELAGAARRYGSLSGTVLVASGAAATLYVRALDIGGADDVVVRDAEACVREGLHAAASILFFQREGTPR